MDREIERSVRRRRLAGRLGAGAAALAAVSLLLALLPGWLSPSLRHDRIRTARVERGRVEATVEAAGTVLPASEGIVSSPIDTRVLRVLRRPGEEVGAGDVLLELDTSATRLELDRLRERLAQKENEQEQIRLALERTLADLRAKARTGELDVEILAYRVQQRRKLHAEGLISEEALREVEVEARKAEIELTQVSEAVANERRSAEARLQGLSLDLAILRKEADDAGRRLELATARADRPGVLTWIREDEGAAVRDGDILARIADLGSFRVEASVSDVHAARLRTGQPARVVLDDLALDGSILSIDPTIENGVARFDVALEEPDHADLRSNLRVDVHVVTDARDGVLKVRQIPYARGGAVQDAFVIHGDRALRTRIRAGISGFDEFEVLEGLQEGDVVIVSDMQDYLHMESVKLTGAGH